MPGQLKEDLWKEDTIELVKEDNSKTISELKSQLEKCNDLLDIILNNP